MAWAEEADEEARRARRERKLEKKKADKEREQAAAAPEDGGLDPEMAALMGFTGFAGGK